VKAGFCALAIDFRGYGQSRGPQSKSADEGVEYDVLAAYATPQDRSENRIRYRGELWEARRPPMPLWKLSRAN